MSCVKRERSISESLHFLTSYIMKLYLDPQREGNLSLLSEVFFAYYACKRIQITMREIRVQFVR